MLDRKVVGVDAGIVDEDLQVVGYLERGGIGDVEPADCQVTGSLLGKPGTIVGIAHRGDGFEPAIGERYRDGPAYPPTCSGYEGTSFDVHLDILVDRVRSNIRWRFRRSPFRGRPSTPA